jgi:hypothetical protein
LTDEHRKAGPLLRLSFVPPIFNQTLNQLSINNHENVISSLRIRTHLTLIVGKSPKTYLWIGARMPLNRQMTFSNQLTVDIHDDQLSIAGISPEILDVTLQENVGFFFGEIVQMPASQRGLFFSP